MDKELNNLLQDESEDSILAKIQEESLRYYNEVELPRRAAEELHQTDFDNKDSHINHDPQPMCSKNNNAIPATQIADVFYKADVQGADGFHLAAGEIYVYPTNYPVRKYQKNIVHSALFHNTLVSLPTGLGKTFIAAVVMYNYYRWFPEGKVVFMAPTRPLVAQQIRACHDIMAVPVKDTVEMTGTMNPVDRLQHWKSKRVFFLTPQVMANDLRSGVCPAKSFKCVVIDEAHRATKEYSYCQVIRELEKAGAVFRILALSATPGSNIRAVVEVVENLRISTLELRSEDSPDVAPYTYAKQIEPVTVVLSKNIIDFRERFLLIFERYARGLRESRLITCNVQNLSKFQLLKASEKLRTRPPTGITKGRLGALISDFTVCMTLAHGLELLQTYGLRAFCQYFVGGEEEENRKAAFTRISQDTEFHDFMDSVQKSVSLPMDQCWSHPKHEHLVKILKEHFCKAKEECNNTKVIIFCQYRVVVSELYELLQTIHPLIKPAMFIGQGVGKDRSGIPQKKQIEIMKQFRMGKSNVLIATCVAEEGLDIGSVDLLVLMEVQRSPVRLVQRLGRTGRHRQGHCVVLLTQGREVQKFKEAMALRSSFISNIQNSKVLAANLYKDEPTMMPSHIMPKMQLVHIDVPERITPNKIKKQSDIREALISKPNTHQDSVKSPFITSEEIALLGEELNKPLNFNTLKSKTEYLYQRFNDTPMDSEEMFLSTFCQYSKFNDINRMLTPTYLLSHSTDTESLCHLLRKSELMLLGKHPDLKTQIILPDIKNKKLISSNKMNCNAKNIVIKHKNDKGENHGTDIRDCLTRVADKMLSQKANVLKDNPINVPDSSLFETSLGSISKSNSRSSEINTNNNVVEARDTGCLICSQSLTKQFLQNRLTAVPLGDQFSFTLSHILSVKNLVRALTREKVVSVNMKMLFTADIGYAVKNVASSLQKLKNYKVSPRKNVPLDIIDVNDIFEPISSQVHYPVFTNLKQTITTINTPTKVGTLEKSTISNPKQEHFNLDDIFDDGLEFTCLGPNTKTSTPVGKHCSPVTNKLLCFPKTTEKERTVSVVDNQDHSKTIHVSETNFLSSSPEKSVFKIPQVKFSKSPKNIANLSTLLNSASPDSPILSGQIPLSNSLPLVNLERKALFSDEGDREDSFLCKPLDGQTDLNKSEEAEEMDMLSASQLFDDNSDNEDAATNLDQSSMYTISQMVEKVSEIANLESLNSVKNTNEIQDAENIKNKQSGSEFFYEKIGHEKSSVAQKPTIYKQYITNEESNKLLEIPNDLICIKPIEKSTNFSFEESKCNNDNSQIKNLSNYGVGNKAKVLSSTICESVKKQSLQVLPFEEHALIYEDSAISSKWSNCLKSPIKSPKKTPYNQTDSDSNSDIFDIPLKKQNNCQEKDPQKKLRKVKKPMMYLELEADVTGPPCSSDENTSGLDDIDESFINDLTELPSTSVDHTSTDMHFKYLQSVKSPVKKSGFKIPTFSKSELAMDVFSQIPDDESDSYENDSFCCDETEIQVEDDPSILEIAENILKHKKSRKLVKKPVLSSESSSEDISYIPVKKKKILRFDSSAEELPSDMKNKEKRKRLTSSDSSSEDQPVEIKKSCKKKKKLHLLTSESDSDRTL